ncbi:MAG TPA: amidohydrolase family protein, partial [Thermoanaerobaculia bacterium]|nr:amidohydrolase family protein [Thermoanaerobaculia bacterium]
MNVRRAARLRSSAPLLPLLLALLVSGGPAPAQPAPPAAPDIPALTVAAARILDVDSGKVLAGHLVRIEGGRITAVEARKAGQAVDLDLGDVTLLPGLIDAHTHLIGGEEETPFDALRETAAGAAIAGVANARKTLLAGFTTVRDLGSR